MGYSYVSVFLRDGRRFDRVCIVGGTISSIDGSAEIPFSEADITEIRVTHERPRKSSTSALGIHLLDNIRCSRAPPRRRPPGI
jgi:hypothetical protein